MDSVPLLSEPQDEVLDVLDVLLTDLLARVGSQEKRRRPRTIGSRPPVSTLHASSPNLIGTCANEESDGV